MKLRKRRLLTGAALRVPERGLAPFCRLPLRFRDDESSAADVLGGIQLVFSQLVISLENESAKPLL
jgi:hypothetical protein